MLLSTPNVSEKADYVKSAVVFPLAVICIYRALASIKIFSITMFNLADASQVIIYIAIVFSNGFFID